MLILALAAAATAPQPGELKTFKDWTVGCDNGRACMAVALAPESWPEDAASLVLRRGPEPDAVSTIQLAAEQNGVATAEAGGRRFRLEVQGDTISVARGNSSAFVTMLRSAPELRLLDNQGKVLGRVSLTGASAALLYMDEQQRRIGTVSALARPGRKPASLVPPRPALPVIPAPKPSKAPVPRLDTAALLKAHADLDCDRAAKPGDVQVARLDAEHSVVVVPNICDSGAYNFSSIVLVADNRGRTREAKFQTPPGFTDDATIINGGWDEKTRRITSYNKVRGLGDCGVAQSYAWDGTGFRLTELSRMDECRGSRDWITLWRAEVR